MSSFTAALQADICKAGMSVIEPSHTETQRQLSELSLPKGTRVPDLIDCSVTILTRLEQASS